LHIAAENFSVSKGWTPRDWGDNNYFCSDLNNVFLSRRAYLQGLANQSDVSGGASATATVVIPSGGNYSVLVRYEAVYHFNQGFRIAVSQNGQRLFSQVYGLRENLKLWAFAGVRKSGTSLQGAVIPGSYASCGGGLQAECVWSYGPSENLLWEGVGKEVNLAQGTATITLTLDDSTNYSTKDVPLANRNLDVVMLFPNATDIQSRMSNYETDALALPLDGLLNQAGEVFAKFTNLDAKTELNLTLPGVYELSFKEGNHLTLPIYNSTTGELVSGCTARGGLSHHIAPGIERVGVAAAGPSCPRIGGLLPGASTGWIEVGRLWDTLNFATWNLPRGVRPIDQTSNYSVTVATIKAAAMLNGGLATRRLPPRDDELELLGTFRNDNCTMQLLVDASTRATRRVRGQSADLYDLMETLDAVPFSPRRTVSSEDRQIPIYASTFPRIRADQSGIDDGSHQFGPLSKRYLETVARFERMFNVTGMRHGQSTLNSNISTPAFEKMLDKLWVHCNTLFDPITDPAHAKMRAAINLTLRVPLRRGVNSLIGNYYISFGDEIQVASVPSNVTSLPLAFKRWATKNKLGLKDVGCEEWQGCYVTIVANLSVAIANTRRYYYSTRFAHDYGIEAYRTCTTIAREFVPKIQTAANFNPSTGAQENAYQWVRSFREESFTYMWAEDWVFNEGGGESEQIVSLGLHLGQAGLRNYSDMRSLGSKPSAPIMMFVMPMFPGNTPNALRRQLYMYLSLGVKMINWWPLITWESSFNACAIDYRPYAEHPPAAMFLQIRELMAEVALFDDILWQGHRGTHAKVALLYSEVGDIWGTTNVQAMQATTAALGQRSSFVPPRDCTGTLGTGKRTLFLSLRHAQLVVDIVIEDDVIDNQLGRYAVVYVAEPAVSRACAAGLARYVEHEGGTIYGTASAGMLDEFNQTNVAMQQLFGLKDVKSSTGTRGANNTISLGKMDLPWAEVIDSVSGQSSRHSGGDNRSSNLDSSFPVFGLKVNVAVTVFPPPAILATFTSDDSPALLSRALGAGGQAIYSAFLPGLSYFHPALPVSMPVDRSASDSGGSHFIPHAFATTVLEKFILGPAGLVSDVLHSASPVHCSEPLVDAGFIAANSTGSAVVLSNWSGKTIISDLVVTLALPAADDGASIVFESATLASGGKVTVQHKSATGAVFVLDTLEVADAIILR
jgi:hypothetical protein